MRAACVLLHNFAQAALLFQPSLQYAPEKHTKRDAAPRMDDDRLADHEAVLDELPNVLARVRHGDLVRLVRVEPDAVLARLEDGRREALL